MNWTTDPSSPWYGHVGGPYPPALECTTWVPSSRGGWTPVRTCRPSGAVNGPPAFTTTPDDRQLLLLAMGLIGGVGIGYHAVHHLFVEGMEDKERNYMIKFGAGAAVLYGLSMLVDLEPYKYLINPFAWLDEQVGGGNAQIP